MGASTIPPQGGRGMLPHQSKTSMVLFCRMVCTRGGMVEPVVPPRVYTNPFGVKVRKVHGGYVFQPVSLKVSSYLVLDRYNSKVGQPRSQLYEGVQKFLDKVIDQGEDRLLGIDSTGIWKLNLHYVTISFNSAVISDWWRWSSHLLVTFVVPTQDQIGCSDSDSVYDPSEFSSTPNASTHTTPESSPAKKRRVEKPASFAAPEPQPSTSKGVQKSKGKDLSLLMTAWEKKNYLLPKDSLYFRENRSRWWKQRLPCGRAQWSVVEIRCPQNPHGRLWHQNRPGKMLQELIGLGWRTWEVLADWRHQRDGIPEQWLWGKSSITRNWQSYSFVNCPSIVWWGKSHKTSRQIWDFRQQPSELSKKLLKLIW